jgi:hypothetical protein
MPRPIRLRRALLASLLPPMLLAGGGTASKDKPPTLGLCAAQSGRLDDYMQALCDGEAALRADDTTAALARFGLAARLPRAAATNELAWAGLAVAHCRARDFDSGRQWAEYFNQARQLWLGEVDCDTTAGNRERTRPSPFVHSRMCSEQLVADYALLRLRPDADYTLELKARLDHVARALAQACASAPVTTAASGSSMQATKAGDEKPAAAPKKRAKRPRAASAAPKPRAQARGPLTSGTPESPVRER